MNLYFAPLEGIGGYIYRNAQADYFEKADKYYSPFLAPNQNRSISPKEYKDIAPEHNEDITLIPLASDDFFRSTGRPSCR